MRGTSRTIDRRRNARNEYVYGNTARALRPIREENFELRNSNNYARRNRERATHMNPAYVMFLTFAMICTVCACIQYLRLQSDVTSKVKELTALETKLNDMKAENDDTECRIKGAVDLENIKFRAMNELGMQYANEDQIVSYACEDTDYVAQLIDIE